MGKALEDIGLFSKILAILITKISLKNSCTNSFWPNLSYKEKSWLYKMKLEINK